MKFRWSVNEDAEPETLGGRSLGGYRLERLLGKGAMGEVYLARDEELGREVAVKVQAARGERERFEREGEVMARLNHPHVVRVFNAGEEQGLRYLALELIPDARSIDEAWGSELRRRIELLRDAALGLGAAHAAGVVHRDVKPANLLVDGAGRLRVTDFGVSTALDLERLTKSGIAVGTPAWMSPEQLKGSSKVGPWVDVWGLGVILYQALCGRLPFDGRTWLELANQVSSATPAPPSELSEEVAPELEALCLRCLAREPEQRPRDGAAVAAALDDWLSGGPARRRRERRVLALGVVVIGLIALATALISPSSGEPPRPVATPASELLRRARAGEARAMRFLARELLAEGQVEQARTWLQRGAEAGDLPAMLALADVAPAEEATRWLRRAAELGDAVGMRRLGLALLAGGEAREGLSWLERADSAGDALAPRELGLRQLEVPFRPSEPALELLQRAVERGDGAAAFYLGGIYLAGWRVPRDPDRGGRWFLQARDLGHPVCEAQLPAQLSLSAGAGDLWLGLLRRAAEDDERASFLFARALGSDERERARVALRRAAEGGFLPAMRLLGQLLLTEAEGRDPTSPQAPSADELGEVWLAKAAARGDVRAATHLGVFCVRNDDPRGVQRLLQSAQRGDPLAMRSLGMVYVFGHDGPADEAKAMRWYARGAELGDVECKARLGWLLYQHGSKSRAEGFLRNAAEAGDPNAASNLAVLLHERARPGDYEAAAELLRTSAEAGDGQGMRNYAKVLERGWGVPEDPAAAKRWYRKAAEADNADALIDLAAFCWRTEDTVEAIRWWERAAELGDTAAMSALGRAFLSRERGLYDLERSLRWWRKAALEGSIEALSWLGHAYLRGNHVKRDPQAAVRLLRQASQRGDTDSLVTLGVAYENGVLLAKDLDKAVGCYSQAAERGNPRGMYNLAVCYREGSGVAKNEGRARAWLERCVETASDDETVRSMARKELRRLPR